MFLNLPKEGNEVITMPIFIVSEANFVLCTLQEI